MQLSSLYVLLGFLAAHQAAAEEENSTGAIEIGSGKLFARGPYCQAPGAVNGQCGEYYSGTQCGGSKVGQIPPDCSGQCYPVSGGFWSVKATGDGTYGTNCALYSDSNCQNELGSTGNSVTAGRQKCATGQGMAHSLKCYFKC
ncbi:hypothetical protein GQ53DRAFT_863778 [Thozetella sp. PMI_491]|nr:hypothetical protein GQ53DRAFT_863778 [Thozetella sp. PMI_491]